MEMELVAWGDTIGALRSGGELLEMGLLLLALLVTAIAVGLVRD